jgi:hypothetical protein
MFVHQKVIAPSQMFALAAQIGLEINVNTLFVLVKMQQIQQFVLQKEFVLLSIHVHVLQDTLEMNVKLFIALGQLHLILMFAQLMENALDMTCAIVQMVMKELLVKLFHPRSQDYLDHTNHFQFPLKLQ